MHKFILFLLFITINIPVIAQKNTKLTLTSGSDTIFWKRNQEKEVLNFQLPQLDTTAEFVFRYWVSEKLLEIKKSNGSISGSISFFAVEFWDDEYETDHFVKTYALPSSKAINIYDYISKNGIQDMPSDRYIKGWQQGFDGRVHVYEIKIGNSYSFKKFWNPSTQHNIKEAHWIIAFNKAVNELGEFQHYSNDFRARIPFVVYKVHGSAMIVSKILTAKESRKYNREQKRRIRNGVKLEGK